MRIRDVDLDALEPNQRAALEHALAGLYLESFIGPTPEQAIESFIRRGPNRGLQVYEDEDEAGTLLGFTSISITPYELCGVDVAVVDSGIYLRRGVRGLGGRGLFAILTHARNYQAQHPHLRLASIGLALTPASYRLVVRNDRSFRPVHETEAEPHIDAMIREFLTHKELEPVTDDPWVVRRTKLGVRPRSPERFPTLEAIRADPDMRYYVERNPGWAEGDALLTFYSPPDVEWPVTARRS